MALPTYTEAVAHADNLRKAIEQTLSHLMLTPSLTASILTDIEEYADAQVRVHSIAAAEVMKGL